MQETHDPPHSSSKFAEIQDKTSEDSRDKVKTNVSRCEDEAQKRPKLEKPLLSELEAGQKEEREQEDDGDDDDDNGGSKKSLISRPLHEPGQLAILDGRCLPERSRPTHLAAL
ncbi:hypothetical protein ACJRO7_027112 [Eucalyptus globulus]|uniref:Uncharacterized protein n=1 Tax=Eucalyptus globulus TaxID=34317 RepID=A0ABD3JW75_EUCGL